MRLGDWNWSIDFVLRHEGGYANDPSDPGGETNFGISKRAHPEVDVAALTPLDAARIYRADYWQRIRGDDLPRYTALAVLDWTVHSGTPAAKALQRLVGATADGTIGPKTLDAVFARVDDETSDRILAEEVCLQRALFAGRWIAREPARRGKFAPGFMVRIAELVACFSEDDL